ncbi:type I-E CRISPR-associated protein Cse2/CasB [Streptomyces aurantiacus]|uniref:CRISPR-associated protein Cse1 n=1 Tax=Streptomyces aurantiacus JA 4570 TaxID=1286094 RepID=S3ZEG2_9ACTN|nr:type I-E CRISPR-associated protein Cse2/CasB [Streptomyces aurantiacus]EPH41024.1 hypothetical protein STRAU_5902 [Streptomyces aurantiacus JA 4570]
MRFQPCITALTIGPDQGKSPRLEKVTLLEAFERAEEITAVVHDSPGAQMALYELLLGLCAATGVHPRTAAQHRQWVTDRHPLTAIADQLRTEDFDGLLDLTHPEHPFAQNALLRPHLAHGYGPAQLELERAGDYVLLFDHVHLHDGEPVPIEDAFHALLAQHAYGLGGRVMAKTSWFGSAFTYAAVGRLAGRIRTLALGDSLADTLRLNLTPCADGGRFNYSWTRGRPRRTFSGPDAKKTHTPDGPADLHSTLGRSVLLSARADEIGRVVVDKVLMGAGELLEPTPDSLQDAAMNGDKPLQASEKKALWRDAHALYAAATPSAKGSDLFSRLVRLNRPVRLWSVGLIAENRNVTGWVSDTFPFHGAHHQQLRRAAHDGAAWAALLAGAATTAAAVARDVAYPNARPEERAKLLTRFDPAADLWARFAEPFHTLLDAISAGADAAKARAAFAAAAVTATRTALGERLRSLPRTGSALEAAARAQARLESELTKTKHPLEITEAATMDTAPPSTTPAPHTAAPTPESQERAAATGPRALGHWLAGLIRRHDRELLGQLQRPKRPPRLQAWTLAGNFAPTDSARDAYELTAHLFARYHAALPWQDPRRLYGSGDLGRTLRRIGTPGGYGPADPGCHRLFERLCTPGALPRQHLAHAIDRLRALDRIPPSWAQLADDLAAFTSHDDHVQHTWACSFFTPNSPTRQGVTTPCTATSTSTR